MKIIKSFFGMMVLLLFLGAGGYFFYNYYYWIFAKTVKGKILDVQRVTNPTAIINSNVSEAQIHSYSVLIEGEDGKLYTASSEDRQWQVAGKGYCVTTKLYRYPPWNLNKGGTFFNARIEEMSRCGSPVEAIAPVPTPHTPTSALGQPAPTEPTPAPTAPAAPIVPQVAPAVPTPAPQAPPSAYPTTTPATPQ